MKIYLIKNRLRINYLYRILFLFITFFFFQIQISQAQQVSLSNTRLTLRKAFTEIERQADMSVDYNREIIDVNKTVSIPRKEGSLSEIMTTLLQGTGCTYVVRDNHIVISKVSVTAQQTRKNVAGIITDQQGEPIIGANIIEKGTTNGTVTDIDGNFRLQVEENAILQISYIGYLEQEVKITGKNFVNIVLQEDLKTLEEIVVIGYGVQKKMDLTGSIANLDQKVVSSLPVSSIDQKMVGQIAGVHIQQQSGTPGGGTSVKIRGNGSIGAGNEPLYVVDGTPYSVSSNQNSNPLLFINPNDIESVTVLKDASSTAIYGSRGANGVVIITTKKGSFEHTSVSFSAMSGLQQVPQKGRPKMMNQKEFAQFQQDKIKIVVRQRENRDATSDDYPEAYRYPELMVGDGTDWYDLILRQALIQDYNLNVQKGSRDIRSNFSIGYYNQEGVVEYTDVKRYNAKLSVDYKIDESVLIGATLQPAYTKQRVAETGINRNDILGMAIWGNPVVKPYENGELIPYITSPGNSFFKPWDFANPLFVLREQSNNYHRFQNIGSVYLNWDITPDLSFKTNFNTIWNTVKYVQYIPGTIGGANRAPTGYGSSNNSRDERFNWLSENTLSYNKIIGKHNFNTLLGFTAQKEVASGIGLTGYPYRDDLIRTINAAQTISSWSEAFNAWSMISYLGRVNYNYNDRYLLTTTFRTDGSSRFGKENRFAFFPSIAGAWRISEEVFLKNNPLISNLKMRLSWGKSGNNNIGNYTHIPLMIAGSYVFDNNQIAAYHLGQSNPYLGWEESNQTDLGIDIGFFDNRLSFVVDYYHRKSINMLLDNVIPAITGFNSQKINGGNIRNTGLEFSLDAMPIVGDFSWNVNVNMGLNKNKVIFLNDNIERITAGNNDSQPTHITVVGKPIGQFFGFIFEGLYTAEDIANPDIIKTPQVYEGAPKYRDIDGDGIINDLLDYTIIGDPHPDFVYGITNSFHYKGFDLSIIMHGQYGGDVVNGLRQTVDNQQGFFNVSREWVDRWKSAEVPGDGIHYGIPIRAPSMGHRFSGLWIEDASYLRIANITLGYNLPEKWLNRFGSIQNCKIYFTAQNLATFTKYKGANPEAQAVGFDNTLAPGYDMTSYPLARTMSCGLNISF